MTSSAYAKSPDSFEGPGFLLPFGSSLRDISQ